MISTVNRLAMLLLIGVVTSSVAFAQTIKKEVRFTQELVVNGTVVKEGTYTVTFDDQTSELSIIKGKKVIAKAPARLEKLDLPAGGRYVFREEGDKPSKKVLLTVALKGDNQATIVGGESKSTSAQ